MIRIAPEIAKLCSTKAGRATAIGFLPAILENIKAMDQKIGRRLVGVAVLGLLFELLTRSSVGEISYSGIQVTDHSVIERLIPALISFLYFESWMLVASRRLLEDFHDKIVECSYQSLWKMDLELYLRPPHLIKGYILLSRESAGWRSSAVRWSIYPILITLAVSVPIFLIYTMVRLVLKYGYFDLLTIVSFVSVIFFVGQMILFGTSAEKVVTQGSAAGSGGDDTESTDNSGNSGDATPS